MRISVRIIMNCKRILKGFLNEKSSDVLETKDEWFGVTYQEDKASVQAAFKKLTDDGVYPEGLYQ